MKNIQEVLKSVLSIFSITQSIQSTFTYTSKGSGEVSKVVVDHTADFDKLYRDDVLTLTNIINSTKSSMELVAAEELKASLLKSLEVGIGHNPRNPHKNVNWVYFNDKKGRRIRGIKMNPDTFEVLVKGVVVHKDVLDKGTYKTVKSRQKTIAKNKLRKMLKSSKIRNYLLPRAEGMMINGMEVS